MKWAIQPPGSTFRRRLVRLSPPQAGKPRRVALQQSPLPFHRTALTMNAELLSFKLFLPAALHAPPDDFLPAVHGTAPASDPARQKSAAHVWPTYPPASRNQSHYVASVPIHHPQSILHREDAIENTHAAGNKTVEVIDLSALAAPWALQARRILWHLGLWEQGARVRSARAVETISFFILQT